MILLVGSLGCATEIHRSSCSCEIVQAESVCRIEHEEHAFKKRPLLQKVFDAIGGAVGWLIP